MITVTHVTRNGDHVTYHCRSDDPIVWRGIDPGRSYKIGQSKLSVTLWRIALATLVTALVTIAAVLPMA